MILNFIIDIVSWLLEEPQLNFVCFVLWFCSFDIFERTFFPRGYYCYWLYLWNNKLMPSECSYEYFKNEVRL